jgi:trans-2,3-dihydro-3-hydroxyanthranilate isomerase
VGARYLVVDVFAREPLAGNALAVFPDPGSVEADCMQKIAREMNLSETTFVTALRPDGYDVRIFTPTNELPFAGHPTLGTAWTLRHLQAVRGDRVVQRSAAGDTPVTFEGEHAWLERDGDGGKDLRSADVGEILDVLDIGEGSVGLDAAEIGGPKTRLLPAVADAGIAWLMLPLVDAAIVARLVAPTTLGTVGGVYCFAPLGPGRLKARFFAPGHGVPEDPATGSAAAALGLYLGDRLGAFEVEIEQGAEIGRPSFISLRAEPGKSRVGGQVKPASEGALVG